MSDYTGDSIPNSLYNKADLESRALKVVCRSNKLTQAPNFAMRPA